MYILIDTYIGVYLDILILLTRPATLCIYTYTYIYTYTHVYVYMNIYIYRCLSRYIDEQALVSL